MLLAKRQAGDAKDAEQDAHDPGEFSNHAISLLLRRPNVAPALMWPDVPHDRQFLWLWRYVPPLRPPLAAIARLGLSPAKSKGYPVSASAIPCIPGVHALTNDPAFSVSTPSMTQM